ncbi:MAG: hypothetical protein D6732_20015 [Methanobacteriota archaeon]|nr:MAG: hypothetical protein D6732_20015 [Euryarchaeota archaeon]
MKVRCIAEQPDEEQAKQLGDNYQPGKQEFGVEIGKEYIVFGLSVLGGSVWIDIESEMEYIYPVPLCLFEIIDGRVSKYWEIRTTTGGNVLVWPSSFFREYFHDDLSEGVPEVLEEFRRIKMLMEAEANSK